MSYILDALRRAESERERGTVPTLSANPAAADLADDDVAVRRARPWVWAGALLLLALLGATAAYRLLRDDAVPPAPPPAPPVQSQPMAAPPRPPAVQGAAVAPPPVEAKPAPEAKPRVPPRPPASTAVVERSLPMASGLPEDLRRQLPPLVAGGAMYSESAAHRILIVNGQLFREGDKIAPELVLEQIRHRGAVLSFKGQRFRISY
ncbi:MAG: general secretion pathway protein GspB [Burkholderiaceae bacterium]|nr:general secretion pathway protein GspB [Burkholderiaceae bacterium]